MVSKLVLGDNLITKQNAIEYEKFIPNKEQNCYYKTITKKERQIKLSSLS